MSNTEKSIYKTNISNIFNILNTVYSNNEYIFRELITNSIEAIQKKQKIKQDFSSFIKIKYNDENQELTIYDNGIGMDFNDLDKYIGTIGLSNTDNMGIGLYFIFKISNHFSIITKKNDNPQLILESNCSGDYTIKPYDGELNFSENETGSYFIIKLLENDLFDYKTIITKYFDYIDIPIYLWSYKTTINEIEQIYEDFDEEYLKEHFNDVEENEYETRINVSNNLEWIQINYGDKNSKDKQKLYFNLTANLDQYLYCHTFEYNDINGIIFIPNKHIIDIGDNLNNMSSIPSNINIYKNNILVKDNYPNIIPEWLNFIYGIIEVKDLSLNIAKDTINSIENIRNQITNIILDLLIQLDNDTMKQINSTYSFYFKMGLCLDDKYENQLLSILKFKNNKNSQLLPIEDFVNNNEIHYFKTNQIGSSPFLEKYLSQDKLILLLDEPIDDFIIRFFSKYTMINIIHNLDTTDISFQYQPLIKLFNHRLNNKIKEVVISNRLTDSMGCIYSNEYNLNDELYKRYNYQLDIINNIENTKELLILELNPNHHFIQKINDIIINQNTYNLDNVIDYIYICLLINSNLYSIIDLQQEDINIILTTNLSLLIDSNNNDNITEEETFEEDNIIDA